MHLALAGGRGDFQQGMQHFPADAANAKQGQHQQGELRCATFGDVLGMAQHLVVGADGEHGDAVPLVERIEALQQREVRRLAVREMAFVESVAIHRGEKAGDADAVVRVGRAHLKLRRIGPRLAGAHDGSPATKSTLAWITIGSSSTRRCPSPAVSSMRARGQLLA